MSSVSELQELRATGHVESLQQLGNWAKNEPGNHDSNESYASFGSTTDFVPVLIREDVNNDRSHSSTGLLLT